MGRMKETGAVMVAVAAALAMAGCSAAGGSAASGTSTSPHATTTPTPVAATYTAAQVGSIVTAAQKQLGITGSIQTVAQLKAQADKLTGGAGLSSIFSAPGTSVSPKECGDLLKKGVSAVPAAGTVGSVLIGKTGEVLTVATVEGKQLPATDKTDAAGKLDQVLQKCSSMTISITENGQSLNIPMTIDKVAATTNADTTVAVQEDAKVSVGSTTTHMTTSVVSAVYGNLIVEAQQIRTSAMKTAAGPSPADMVNAVVAAAKTTAG